MVPPIKRPILPIVISISPNSKEPLTTQSASRLLSRLQSSLRLPVYLYHEDGRSALHPAHVFQHLDEYRDGAYRQDSCQEHGVIERPAKLCAPTANPSPRITRTSITAMPVPPFLPVARSWFGVGMQARPHRAGAQ